MATQQYGIKYRVGFETDQASLQKTVNEAISALQKIGTNSQFGVAKELQDASSAAYKLGSILKGSINMETGKFEIDKFRQKLQQSGMTLEQYRDKLAQLGPQGKNAFGQVADAITSAELPMRRVNTLLDKLWATMKNTIRWQFTSRAWMSLLSSIRTAYSYSQDLNESLNNIRIVTGHNADEMARFAENANKAAAKLNTTTTEYADASLIYFQQGLDDAEVERRTAVTIKLANAAGISAEQASSQLTAIWNNFSDGSDNLERYADVLVKLGATTASSSEEISKGMQKFAAVANTVGLSYDYAASALATIVAETRTSAEEVGTSLRTIFARFESLKLGETLEDGVDLNKYTQALADVGVNVLDSNGQLRQMDDILDDIFKKWGELNQAQLNALATTVAGVKQYANFIAFFKNADAFYQNVATARGAEGTLQKQADIYAEGWKAAKKEVKNAAQDIYDSLINADFFIDFDKKYLAPLLHGIANIVDGFNGLKGILPFIVSMMTQLYSTKIAQGMRDIVQSTGLITNYEQKKAQALQQQMFSASKDLINTSLVQNKDDENVEARLFNEKQLLELKQSINRESSKWNEEQKQQAQGIVNSLERQQSYWESIVAEIEKAEEELKGYQERINIASEIQDTSLFSSNDLTAKNKYAALSGIISLPVLDTTATTEQYIEALNNINTDTAEHEINQMEAAVKQLDTVLQDQINTQQKQSQAVIEAKEKYQELKNSGKELFSRSELQAIESDLEKVGLSLGQLGKQESISHLDYLFKILEKNVSSTNISLSSLEGQINNIDNVAQNTKGLDEFTKQFNQLTGQDIKFDTWEQAKTAFDAFKSKLNGAKAVLVEATKELQQNQQAWTDLQNKMTAMTPRAKKLTESIQQLGERKGGLTKLIQDLNSLQGSSKLTKDQVDKLNTILKTIGVDTRLAEGSTISEAVKLLGQESKKTTSDIIELREAIAKVPEAILPRKQEILEAFDGMITSSAQARTKILEGSVALDTYGEKIKNADEEMRKLKQSQYDWATTITMTISALTAGFSAAEGFTGAIKKINDTTATSTEKIQAIKGALTSLGPLIMQVSRAIKAIGQGGAAAAAGWVGIILAVASVVITVLNELGVFKSQFEKLNEDIETAKNAYENTVSRLEAINNELETTQKRIDELNAKDSLTLIEQTELDKLEASNEALKNQQALLENNKNLQAKTLYDTYKLRAHFGYQNEFEGGRAIGGVNVSEIQDKQLAAFYNQISDGNLVLSLPNDQTYIRQGVLTDRLHLPTEMYELSQHENPYVRAWISNLKKRVEQEYKYQLAQDNPDAWATYWATNSEAFFQGQEEFQQMVVRLKENDQELTEELVAYEENRAKAFYDFKFESSYVGTILDTLIKEQPQIIDTLRSSGKDALNKEEQYMLFTLGITPQTLEEILKEYEVALDGYGINFSELTNKEILHLISWLDGQSFEKAYAQVRTQFTNFLGGERGTAEFAKLSIEEVAAYWKMMATYPEASFVQLETLVDNFLSGVRSKEAVEAITIPFKATVQGINDLIAALKAGKELTEDQQNLFDWLAKKIPVLSQLRKDSKVVQDILGSYAEVLEAKAIKDAASKAFALIPPSGVDYRGIPLTITLDTASFDEFLNATYEVEVAIKADLDSDITSLFNQTSSLSSLEGLYDKNLSFEEAFKLLDLYPDILTNMEMVSDTEIRLNSDILKSTIENERSKVQAYSQTLIDKYKLRREDLIQERKNYQELLDAVTQSNANVMTLTKAKTNFENAEALRAKNYTDNMKEIELQKSIEVTTDELANEGKAATESVKMTAKAAKQRSAIRDAEYRANMARIHAEQAAAAGDDLMAEHWKKRAEAAEQSIDKLSNPNITPDLSFDENAITADGETIGNTIGKGIQDGVETSWETLWQDFTSDIDNEDLRDQLSSLLSGKIADIDEEIKSISGTIEALEAFSDKLIGNFDFTKNLDKSGKSAASLLQALKDVIDRYHEINQAIAYQEKILNRVDKAINRAYGPDKLKLLAQKDKELQKSVELERQKLQAAEGYALLDKATLLGMDFKHYTFYDEMAQAFTNIPLAFEFDEETGMISNYTAILTSLSKAYDDLVSKGDVSLKKEGDALKEFIDIFKENSKSYEDSLIKVREQADKVTEKEYASADTRLTIIDTQLQLKLDSQSVKDAVNELNKAFIQANGDVLDYGVDLLGAREKDFDGLMTNIKSKLEYAEQLAYELKNQKEETDVAKITENLKNTISELMSDAKSALEYIAEWEKEYSEAVNAAMERFNWYISRLSHNSTVASTIKELLTLQGVTNKTADGFGKLQKVLQTQLDAAIAQGKLQKDAYDYWTAQVAIANENWNSVKDNVNDINYDRYKNDLQAVIAQQEAAQDAMLASAKESMELARTMYEEQLERAKIEFEQIMTDGSSISELQKQFDHFIDENERYFDEVNTAFQIADWQAKLQADIDNTTNAAHRQQLQLLQEEIETRAEGGKLNQYDLDILNAKYNQMQALMALEDARNNKNTLRLVRDSQGNWNYQYTNNADDVAAQEQKLAQANNEYYNIAKKQTQDVTSQIISLWQECEDEIDEIFKDSTLTEEERNAKIAERKAYYAQKAADLEREKAQAIADLNAAASAAGVEFTNSYVNRISTMTAKNMDFEQNLDTLLDKCSKYYKDFSTVVADVADDTGTDISSLDGYTNDLAESTRNFGDDAKEAWGKAKTALEEYAEKLNSLVPIMEEASQTAQNLKTVGDATAKTIEKTSGLDYHNEIVYDQLGAYAKTAGYSTDVLRQIYSERQMKISANPELSKYSMSWEEFLEHINGLTKYQVGNISDATLAKFKDWLNLMGIQSLATGGYTGDFTDGRLALLHEKELVLNASDTRNILTAVTLTRQMAAMLEAAIDGSANAGLALMRSRFGERVEIPTLPGDQLEQMIHIDQIEFPNVTTASEIQEAFRNLADNASQWARRRKS